MASKVGRKQSRGWVFVLHYYYYYLNFKINYLLLNRHLSHLSQGLRLNIDSRIWS